MAGLVDLKHGENDEDEAGVLGTVYVSTAGLKNEVVRKRTRDDIQIRPYDKDDMCVLFALSLCVCVC